MTSSGGPRRRCRNVDGLATSTAGTTKRCSSCASIKELLGRQKLPEKCITKHI